MSLLINEKKKRNERRNEMNKQMKKSMINENEELKRKKKQKD